MGRAANAGSNEPFYIEPYLNSPIYVAGLARATFSYGQASLAFYIEQSGASGRIERLISHRLIMPAEAIAVARSIVDAAREAAKQARERQN